MRVPWLHRILKCHHFKICTVSACSRWQAQQVGLGWGRNSSSTDFAWHFAALNSVRMVLMAVWIHGSFSVLALWLRWLDRFFADHGYHRDPL